MAKIETKMTEECSYCSFAEDCLVTYDKNNQFEALLGEHITVVDDGKTLQVKYNDNVVFATTKDNKVRMLLTPLGKVYVKGTVTTVKNEKGEKPLVVKED